MGLLSVLTGGDLIKEIGATVRQVLPNKEAQRDFDLKIAELADKADQREQELNLGQIEVNKTEAANANLFVAGWRPAVGWICAGGLGTQFMVRPLLMWFSALIGHPVDFPELDGNLILGLLGALLGIGTMRTYEKTKGLATSVNGVVLQPVLPADPNKTVGAKSVVDAKQSSVPTEITSVTTKGYFDQ